MIMPGSIIHGSPLPSSAASRWLVVETPTASGAALGSDITQRCAPADDRRVGRVHAGRALALAAIVYAAAWVGPARPAPPDEGPLQAPRGLTPAQQRQFTAQALKFVACMRAHGITDMPDPVVNAQGISSRIPAGFSPSSPVFQAAQRACRKLMPGGPP